MIFGYFNIANERLIGIIYDMERVSEAHVSTMKAKLARLRPMEVEMTRLQPLEAKLAMVRVTLVMWDA